jgi:23S rRNA A2030 N6-methylase RlmJ
LEGEVLADARKALRIEAAIDAPEGKLARAGLLVLNPPFGFAAGMEEALAKVAPRLKARTRLQCLAGEE